MSKNSNLNAKPILRRILELHEVGILIPFGIMIIIVGIDNPVLFEPGSLKAMSRAYALFGIVAIGQTIVILTGEFDISVGSIAGFGAVLTMELASHNISPALALILALLACAGLGLINGLVVVKLKISSFITTIAMLYVARGLCFVITKGYPIYPIPDWMQELGLLEPFGTSFGFIFFLVLILFFQWMLFNTRHGKDLVAVGNNERVANLLGIKSERIKIGAFVISGVFACIGGFLLACQMQTAMADIGRGWELKVIAACAIGGISLLGGSGSFIGTFIGICFIALINNGLVLMNVGTHWQDIMMGVIMIFAVYMDLFKKKKSQMVRVKE